MNRRSCVIVGAGMTGITAGRVIQAAGWDVVLVDKGQTCGGRMATRQIGTGLFDSGAQFFTVRDDRFIEAVRDWERAGWVSEWFTCEGHIRYRATGGMNALASRLARSLDVRPATKVVLVESEGNEWKVTAESGEVFRARALLLTPPAPQCAELLAGMGEHLSPDILPALRSIVYDPCLSLLVGMNRSSRVPAPGYVRPVDGPVEWIADNTAKGLALGGAALTIHARAGFSRDYFAESEEALARTLLDAAGPWMGGAAQHWQLKRWRYSRAVPDNRPDYLFSSAPAALVIAGDGFSVPRVEGAFLSGLAGASKLMDSQP